MRVHPRSALLLLPLLALALACDSGPLDPEDADPRLRTSVVPGEDWIRIERPGFSFSLPPGFEKLPLQPIDSDAATYALASSYFHHDYGWYTGPWSNEGQIDGDPIREVVRQWVLVGGKAAELVSFRYGGTWVVRAWWGRVASSHEQDEHLLVRIETDDLQAREALLASIYSVRFD
ncbi:MAG TPA: hypothetical protein VK849_14230 [Longimicrobiales bacterium]|nr:hypothetical protein [Longimicrobiales bacterium]